MVPFTANDQPKEVRDAIGMYADEVVELKLPKQKWDYHQRNKYIVKHSDIVFAFWDGKAKRAGLTYSSCKGMDETEIERLLFPPSVTTLLGHLSYDKKYSESFNK